MSAFITYSQKEKNYSVGGITNPNTTSGTGVTIPNWEPLLAPNSFYRVSGVIRVGCNNTGGVKLAVVVPSGSVLDLNLYGFTTATTADQNQALFTSGLTHGGAFCRIINTYCYIEINGTIETGATPGNATFQFLSGVAGQTSTIFKSGSFLTITKFKKV